MREIKCPDCDKTFDVEMQLLLHTCLENDNIKEAHIKRPEIELDFSKINWRDFYKFVVIEKEGGTVRRWNVLGLLKSDYFETQTRRTSRIVFFSTPYQGLAKAIARRLQFAYDLEGKT